MKLSHIGLLLPACFPLLAAHQPGAADPDPAPIRDLQFGDLNFLHTTDTHGWHAGHLLEGSFSADWGDYIAFTARLKEKLEREGKDLIVIDTGDRIEGNGLYDASHPRGKYTFDIFKEQHIDLLCSGNHELYKNSSAEDDYRKLVPAYTDNYLASNLYIYDPDRDDFVPLAPRSRVFTAKQTGIRVLAFGFVFDFTRNDRNTRVIPVEIAIEQSWFTQSVLHADVDLIVIIGHVALRSYEFELIHEAIRKIKPDIPIQFFGGHYHVRDYRVFDDRAHAIASGRFMETIGFQSIDHIRPNSSNENITFFRRYIDNNLFSLQHHTNTTPKTFHTPFGYDVSESITEARTELNLDQTLGCAAQDYWMSRVPYPHEDSVYTLLTDEVFPDIVNPRRQHKTRMIITNTGAIRFDIFKGAFTRDSTYIVSPFTSELQYIRDVPYGLAKQMLPILNGGDPPAVDLMRLITLTRKWKFDLSDLPPPEQQGINKAKETSTKRDKQNPRLECTNHTTTGSHAQAIAEVHLERLASQHDRTTNGHRPVQRPLQQPLLSNAASVAEEKYEANLNPQPTLTPGYTTLDDLGCDGDDTIHSPITFYEVPNCIQAIFPGSPPSSPDGPSASPTDDEPVDLLFNAFLRPYILHLLNFLPWLPLPFSSLEDSTSDAPAVPELWSNPAYITAMQWTLSERMPSCVIAGLCEDMPPPEDGVRVWEERVREHKERLGIEVHEGEVREVVEIEQVEKRKYTEDDVENYVPGETFTSVFAGWIKENWAKNCPDETHFA